MTSAEYENAHRESVERRYANEPTLDIEQLQRKFKQLQSNFAKKKGNYCELVADAIANLPLFTDGDEMKAAEFMVSHLSKGDSMRNLQLRESIGSFAIYYLLYSAVEYRSGKVDDWQFFTSRMASDLFAMADSAKDDNNHSLCGLIGCLHRLMGDTK